MDDGSQPPLLGLFILLTAAVFSALAETAFSSVQRTKIKVASDKGDYRASKALRILDNFDLAVSTLLIITNISHLGAAAMVTLYVSKTWGLSAVGLSTLIFTVFVFFACELLPKSVAKKYSFRITVSTASLLSFFMKILKPFASVLTAIGRSMAKKVANTSDVSVTEDELQDIIEDMTQEGSISEEEGDLISSALEFGDMTAESILTPRVDVQAVDVNANPEDILNFVKNTTHSRIPVYQTSIDNIIGALGIRKYMKAYLKNRKAPRIRPLIDKVYYAHQSMEIHELLDAMSKNRFNLAVITDSYGGTLGIVTIEDILEELVGDIWDESDVVRESIVRKDGGKWLADADCTLSDVFEKIGFNDFGDDEENENITLGQWCFQHFSSIPENGDSFNYHNLCVTVDRIEHNRILKVLLEVRS